MSSLAYKLRTSPRAKHVRLTVTAQDGLIVTVPKGIRGKRIDIASIIDMRKEWIERALCETQKKRAEYERCLAGSLPLVAELRCEGTMLPITYSATQSTTVTARRTSEAIAVSGNIVDTSGCIRALQRLTRREAAGVLAPRVRDLAAAAGIPFTGELRFKLMRSRWGSCSSKGDLSFSQNLIFLPSSLVDHVILHELAHTVHLDHSPHFHELLRSLDPQKDTHEKSLKAALDYVPAWADVGI